MTHCRQILYSDRSEVRIQILILFCLVCIFCATAAALLRRKRASKQEALRALGFVSRFSADSYRPVAKLLSSDDERFIRESGASKHCIEKFRRRRRKVLRQYLINLSADFNRLFRIGLVMVVNSMEDRSDLAAHLIRQRLQFARSIFVIRVRLILQELGFRTVDRAIMLKLLKLTHAHLELVAATALELCSAQPSEGK